MALGRIRLWVVREETTCYLKPWQQFRLQFVEHQLWLYSFRNSRTMKIGRMQTGEISVKFCEISLAEIILTFFFSFSFKVKIIKWKWWDSWKPCPKITTLPPHVKEVGTLSYLTKTDRWAVNFFYLIMFCLGSGGPLWYEISKKIEPLFAATILLLISNLNPHGPSTHVKPPYLIDKSFELDSQGFL